MFVLAAYFLLGIELVAEEIEEPFGTGGDNLPLETYAPPSNRPCARSWDRPRARLDDVWDDEIELPGINQRRSASGRPNFLGERAFFREFAGFRPCFADNGPASRAMSPTEEEGRWSAASRLSLIGYVCRCVPVNAKTWMSGS